MTIAKSAIFKIISLPVRNSSSTMPIGDLVSQKEAALILNRSVSAVSRAIKDGRLEYADSKNRLLHRPGLEMRFARKTRPRIDKPQRKTQNAKARGAAAPRWQFSSTHRNGLLAAAERQARVRPWCVPCLLAGAN